MKVFSVIFACVLVGCSTEQNAVKQGTSEQNKSVQAFSVENPTPPKPIILPVIDNELIKVTISNALADRCFDDPTIDSAIKAVADQCDKFSKEAPSIDLQKMWAAEAVSIRKIIPASAQATSQPTGGSATLIINDVVTRAVVSYALAQRCFFDTGYVPTLKTIGDKCSKLGIKQASKTLAIRKILSDWDKRPKFGGSLQVNP